MRLFFALAILLLCPGFFSCKSTKKLFDEGHYERAYFSAIDDLRKNASNTSALQLLPEAYQQASRQLMGAIRSAQSGSMTSEKIDRVYTSYNSLQKMYNAAMASPAAANLISPRDYTRELADAADEGARIHYNLGLDLLDRGDKKSAQGAYLEFKTTDSYVPGYKDVRQLKVEAMDRATTYVVVNTINQQFGNYSVNGAFLENDILNSLSNIGRNYYYQFYLLPEAQSKRIRVDQFMDVMMYDIWFGSLAMNTYSYDVSKTIKEPSSNTKEADKSIVVNATVRVTRRIMDSRAAMDCRVSDAGSRQIIFSERFPARYTWEKLTGTYTGDSRALSDKDLAIVNGVYSNPPDYNELYRELTRQIMNNFNSRMRQLYGR
ncbi:MAG: hypothetical protein JST09_10575 [Bacteroidetes bacterium]|nr:hypothetical protein [Bacteroidota bacterium]